MIDSQWRPFRGFVDYCLSFHARDTGGADLLALTPAIDPEVADDAAVSHARSTGWADAKAGRRRRTE